MKRRTNAMRLLKSRATPSKLAEVPQECDSTADVKQMTKSTAQSQQQSQSLLVKLGLLGPEHAGDEPARENPAAQLDVEQAGAVPLDEAPLDETQRCRAACGAAASKEPPLGSSWNVSGSRKKPNVDSEVPELDLQIEHLTEYLAYAAPAPVIECVSPISDVSAATAPENEYAAPALLVCRQER